MTVKAPNPPNPAERISGPLSRPVRLDASTAKRQARQRVYRTRRRAGEVMLSVPVQYFETIEILLRSSRISERDALDKKKVAVALGVLIGDWRRKWTDWRDA